MYGDCCRKGISDENDSLRDPQVTRYLSSRWKVIRSKADRISRKKHDVCGASLLTRLTRPLLFVTRQIIVSHECIVWQDGRSIYYDDLKLMLWICRNYLTILLDHRTVSSPSPRPWHIPISYFRSIASLNNIRSDYVSVFAVALELQIAQTS